MPEPSSAEVPMVTEIVNLRLAVDRLERRASWHAAANLLTLAVAAGALALPFVIQRLDMRELVVQELRIVDDAKTTRARLHWETIGDEAKLDMFDRQARRRVELGSADDATVLELLPPQTTAGLRMQVGEEDVMLTMRHEPEGAPSGRLDVGVHRELVVDNAVAGPSTLATKVARDGVSLHLARSTDGLQVADLDLDPHGPTLELRSEQAGRARLHVPATTMVPEMLVEAKDGATARLTPLPPAPAPSPTPPAPTTPPSPK
jgi:hypothetical protein